MITKFLPMLSGIFKHKKCEIELDNEITNSECLMYKELHIPTDYVYERYTPLGCFYKS